MATLDAYHLEPRSAFHFGERGVGLEETGETFRSDSLFSALCSAVREGWGTARLEELLAAFRDGAAAPFRISSCFPYAGPVRFYPRPMGPLGGEPPPDAAKRLKGARFVSEGLLVRWLEGGSLAGEAARPNFLGESRAWVSAAERAALAAALPGGGEEPARRALWSKDAVPHVAIDRQSNASAVYRSGRLSFREGCGLYFLVRWRDERFRPLVDEALALLGDAGLGGRRSAGYGQFRPLPVKGIDLPDAARPDALLTLSLYWPTGAEVTAGVLGGPARYDLVSRYGWISSPEGRALRRREVRMVAEGSLLAPVEKDPGGLADVTPAALTAHRVYRYGLALAVPVRRPEVRHG